MNSFDLCHVYYLLSTILLYKLNLDREKSGMDWENFVVTDEIDDTAESSADTFQGEPSHRAASTSSKSDSRTLCTVGEAICMSSCT